MLTNPNKTPQSAHAHTNTDVCVYTITHTHIHTHGRIKWLNAAWFSGTVQTVIRIHTQHIKAYTAIENSGNHDFTHKLSRTHTCTTIRSIMSLFTGRPQRGYLVDATHTHEDADCLLPHAFP